MGYRRAVVLCCLFTVVMGCTWHPRTPDSTPPKWAKLSDKQLVCEYITPTGSNRKVRSCRTAEQIADDEAKSKAFVKRATEPRSLLKEQRSRGD